jgi:Putative Zn-dependent protease, contains TPR repeats
VSARGESLRRAEGARPAWSRGWVAKLTLALVAPLLLLLMLEAGLRVVGFGTRTDFFVPDEEPGVFRTNPRFTELFLPASFGLKPANFRLTKAKAEGVHRVFVIGESAAMGVPEPAFALAPQLRAQLRAALPGRQIEVFNLGVTAINSHAILRIVEQAVEFQPDVFVIYMGNNEVVGPYGPGSVVTRGTPPRGLIRTVLWVRSTRLGQLMQWAAARLSSRAAFRDWRGMEMFSRNTVARDDSRLAGVYANFEANLRDIVQIAQASGAQVVLSTVATNVKDCAPFVSRHREDLSADESASWTHAMREASLARAHEDVDRAQAWLREALAIDPVHADTHFQLAGLMARAGKWKEAREHYVLAREEDALRFRADDRINDIIRQVGRASGGRLTLIDAAEELAANGEAGGGPAGAELFFEHVHFRWEGNFALGRKIAPSVAAALGEGEVGGGAWLDAAACARAVGYTGFGRLAMARAMSVLTERPPFTFQSSFAEDRIRLLREIADVERALSTGGDAREAMRQLETALAADPRNPDLLFQAAAVRLQLGQFEGVLALHERLEREVPAAPELASQKGFALMKLGRTAEAERLLRQTAQAFPYYFQTYGLLAEVWMTAGRREEAREFFARLLERMPENRPARAVFAQILAASGDPAGAEAEWRRVLQQVPDDAAALTPLVEHLERSGRADEAIGVMLEAFAYNPRNFDNNARLVAAFEEKGDPAATAIYMQALAASGPVNAQLHAALALNLAESGKLDEARAAAAVARRRAEATGESEALALLRELARRYRQ